MSFVEWRSLGQFEACGLCDTIGVVDGVPPLGLGTSRTSREWAAGAFGDQGQGHSLAGPYPYCIARRAPSLPHAALCVRRLSCRVLRAVCRVQRVRRKPRAAHHAPSANDIVRRGAFCCSVRRPGPNVACSMPQAACHAHTPQSSIKAPMGCLRGDA